MEVPQVTPGHQRIEAVDAARGSAMLFVFFSHFVEVYFRRHDLPVNVAYAVTMIASPAFIAISGVMLGILYCTRRDRFQATKSRFIRRGLFLLTAGRVLIFLAHIPFAGGWQEALRWGFMTDAIGVSIILGPLVIEKLGWRERLLSGVLLIGVSWAAILLWVPKEGVEEACKEMLLGPFGTAARFYADVFPILPWFGLYLGATSVGEYLGELYTAGEGEQVIGVVFRIGMVSMLVAGGLFALRYLLRQIDGEFLGTGGYLVLSPFQKLPPSPVYFLFYGGCAFILLFVLMRYQSLAMVKRYSVLVGVLGRTSLFVFIVQYFAYFGVFALVDFGPAVLWPCYFAISAAGIWGLAFLWDRGNLNRYLIIPELGSKQVEAANH